MDNTFSLLRFFRFFRKTLLERPVQIFGIAGLNFIAVLLMYVFLRDILGWNAAQNLTFVWGMVFGGCYLSAVVFGHFSSNASGASFLTLPGSAFEKWLTGLIITWILYVVVFMMLYKLMDAAFVSYYHSQLNPAEVNYIGKKEAVQYFDLGGHVATMTYIMFANLTASMFVGSLYFNKVGFVKTGLVLCVGVAVAFMLNLGVAHLLFTGVSDAFPFSHVSMHLPPSEGLEQVRMELRPANTEAAISLPSPYSDVYRGFVRYGLSGILCVTAYIRLKEKEF